MKTKNLTLCPALLLAASFLAPCAGAQQSGLKGGEKSKTSVDKNISCHSYKNYSVLVRTQGDSAGSDILVNKAGNCSWDEKEAKFFLKNSGADYFFGLYGKFLFTDSGTGPAPRLITVYDLQKSTTVYSARYSEPIALKKGILRYWSPSGTKADGKNCPDLKIWAKDGLGAAIEEERTVELATLKQSKTVRTRCSARQ